MPTSSPPRPGRRARLLASLVLALAAAAPAPAQDGARRDADLAAARALFEANLAAIRDRDRAAYLRCYWRSEHLVRAGVDGPARGFEPFEAALDDEWPDTLEAHDLELAWLRPGLVYGSYRYHAVFDGEASSGLSQRLFLETEDGWRVALTSAFPAPGAPAPPVALVGATVHDGRGGAPIEDAVVVVRDGRIEAVGPAHATPVPAGVDVVDVSGRFVTPGLVDTHVHYSQTGWADGRPDAVDVRDSDPYPKVVTELETHPGRLHRAFLASGVTAVLDCGGFPWTRRLGEATEDDPLAPHVVAAGPLLATWVPPELTLPDRSQFVTLTAAGAADAVASHAASGSDVIKVWLIERRPLSHDELAARVSAAGEAAREAGLPLIVHATTLATAKMAVAAGAHLLVHSVDDQEIDEELLHAIAEGGVHYCPTLTVRRGYNRLYTGRLGEVREQLDRVSPWVAERVLRTPDVAPLAGRPAELLEERLAERRGVMDANLRRLYEAGARIVLGTDAGNPLTLHGPSVFVEAEAMQAAGMPARAVLVAATSHAADALGRADLGRLRPGAVADLLVLARDPAEDVSNLRSLVRVVRAGTLHEVEDLRPRH